MFTLLLAASHSALAVRIVPHPSLWKWLVEASGQELRRGRVLAAGLDARDAGDLALRVVTALTEQQVIATRRTLQLVRAVHRVITTRRTP